MSSVKFLRQVIRKIMLVELQDLEKDIPVLIDVFSDTPKQNLFNAIFSSSLGTLRFTNQLRDNKILARLIPTESFSVEKSEIERILSQELSQEMGNKKITVQVLEHLG